MDHRNSPYIGIVITAYNRKEFLLNAINSAVNQTLDKKHYEIIVVKNFTDDSIDTFNDKHHIKSVLMDGTIGEFLHSGISASAGDIISFLDDDDLFTEDKLEVVYNKFKDNDNVCYYHNYHTTVNEDYQEFESKVGKGVAFNISSISVRKSILNLDNVKKIHYHQDVFMYLSSLESHKKVIIGKEKLTSYMLHNSISHIETDDVKEFTKRRNENSEFEKKEFVLFNNMFVSKDVKNCIKQRITHLEIVDYIFGGDTKPNGALHVLNKSDMLFAYRVTFYLAYLLVRLHYNFRHIIIRKLVSYNTQIFNINKKS